jgi:hypothetical protein
VEFLHDMQFQFDRRAATRVARVHRQDRRRHEQARSAAAGRPG